MKKREQAEARAKELFPEVDGNDCLWTSRKVVERERDAFLQCYDEMQDNELRKALMNIESLILNKDNHKDGCFKEFPLVLSIIKVALNSKKH